MKHFWNLVKWLTPPLPIARKMAVWFPIVALYCVATWGVHTACRMELSEWGDEAAIFNGLALGLLEGRKLWGQLTNDSRNLTLKARTLLDDSAAEVEALAKLLAGFARALKNHLRGQGALQAIPGYEGDTRRIQHVPAFIAGEVFSLLDRWRREDRIDGYEQLMLDRHARALMDISGACERIKSCPIPPSYHALLRYGICVYVLVAPFFVIHELGLWGIPVVLLVLFPMVSLELAAETIEEPFGTEKDDLALDSIVRSIERVLGEIAGVELDPNRAAAGKTSTVDRRMSFTALYEPVDPKD
jgi:putative membrane protein